MGREKLKLGQITFNSSDTLRIKCESKVCLSQLKKDYTDLFYPQDWYEKESFMDECFIPGEYTIPKSIIKASTFSLPCLNHKPPTIGPFTAYNP